MPKLTGTNTLPLTVPPSRLTLTHILSAKEKQEEEECDSKLESDRVVGDNGKDDRYNRLAGSVIPPTRGERARARGSFAGRSDAAAVARINLSLTDYT